jgi:sugar phosphate permease
MSTDDSPEQRPTFLRYGVLVLLSLAASSAYLTRHCLAVANTTIQEELHFNNTQMGWILGVFSLGYFLCQVPGGWLGDKFGTRVSLPILSVLWSLFTVWTAAVSSYFLMIASRFAFGLAQAGLVPNAAKIIKDWFPLHRRGFVSSIVGVSMSIGGAVTMSLTGNLMETFHWRNIFQMYSLVGIVFAIGFYAFFRSKPYQHSWVNDKELELIRGEINVSIAQKLEESQQTEHISVDVLLRSGNLWAISIQSFFRAAGYNFFVTFFAAFLEYVYHIKPKQAAEYSTWPLLGVVGGGLIGGWLIDSLFRRTGNKRISRCAVAVGALSFTALLTLASTRTSSLQDFVVVISLGAMFSGMAGPSAWTATLDASGVHTSVIVGIMNMAGCISGFVATPLLGWLIDEIKDTNGNWNLVIYLHVAYFLAAAISWIFVRPDKLIVPSSDESNPA